VNKDFHNKRRCRPSDDMMCGRPPIYELRIGTPVTRAPWNVHDGFCCSTPLCFRVMSLYETEAQPNGTRIMRSIGTAAQYNFGQKKSATHFAWAFIQSLATA